MIKKILLFILNVLIISYSFTDIQNACAQQLPVASQAAPSETGEHKSIPTSAGEKYLILNKAPRIGKFRRYRFVVGQQLNFKVKNDKRRFKAKILCISDSSFDLRLFKVSRRIPFVSEAAYYFPIGGLLYIGADFFNKGIDEKSFTTDAAAFIVGGTLILGGFICHKLSSHSIKINKRNTLKVLSSE